MPVGRSLFSWPKPWKPFVCWICAMALTMDVYLFHSTSLSLCLFINPSVHLSLPHLSTIIIIYLLYLFSTLPVISAYVYQYIYFIYLSLYFLHFLSLYLSLPLPPIFQITDRSMSVYLPISLFIFICQSISLNPSVFCYNYLSVHPSILRSISLNPPIHHYCYVIHRYVYLSI